MSISEEQRALHRLAEENRWLQDRVVELESRLAASGGARKEAADPMAEARKFVKLLQAKDQKLEEYAGELEEKTEELERTLADVRQKNAELCNSLAAVRLYQEILASDPAAILCLDADRCIAHFNPAAMSILGEELPGLLLEPAERLPLGELHAPILAMVDDALASGTITERSATLGGAAHLVSVFPLQNPEGIRGAAIRLVKLSGDK